MKKIILIALFSLIMGVTQAQRSGISVTGGIGTFDLEGLQLYQDELIAKMPVEVKGFSYFPTYTNFRISAFKTSPSGLKYGLVYGYSSSGAHANYTDYSGYLNVDQLIHAYQFGATVSYRLLYRQYFEIMAYGDIKLSYVRDQVNMNITTSYYFENNTMILSTVSPFFEAGLESMYHFKKFSIGLEGGYLFDVGSKFNLGDQSVLEPTVSLKPSGEIRSEMSGFRAGIKFLLWFNADMLVL